MVPGVKDWSEFGIITHFNNTPVCGVDFKCRLEVGLHEETEPLK